MYCLDVPSLIPGELFDSIIGPRETHDYRNYTLYLSQDTLSSPFLIASLSKYYYSH